jgi:catalase
VLGEKMAGTEELSERFAFNQNKPDEFGSKAEAKTGRAEAPDDPIVGASTVSEMNSSEKVGNGSPPIGNNQAITPLDRVRSIRPIRS